jgi:hypothetical protein
MAVTKTLGASISMDWPSIRSREKPNMASAASLTRSILLVTFSREGAAEERRICSDGELRAGDSLTVERYKRPTLVERGLA